MEHETLFTASKWDILKLLADQSLSPIELAKRSNTSVANVSQQLRLLEMAGLVKSERISNRDRGQPRILYSLAGNHSYLIASTNDFVEKKRLQLSHINKIVLRIWFFEQQQYQYYLEKAFWNIEKELLKIDAIAIDESSPTNFIIFTRETLKLSPVTVTSPDGTSMKVSFQTTHSDHPDVGTKQLYTIYDPAGVITQMGKEEKK